eukprot:TRINITY_DN15037_c0_g1::TRINITY_DN15037_c0_g1_i1::g.24908::m.24908 TRINITY_DN15037_c0_g1::TRINITY_DN15037_c0_g1_i1::g.24908  ORF type:complete len:159 (-),score=8.33 TRINITY_DN15037_c0_g1_i1:245-721(-)
MSSTQEKPARRKSIIDRVFGEGYEIATEDQEKLVVLIHPPYWQFVFIIPLLVAPFMSEDQVIFHANGKVEMKRRGLVGWSSEQEWEQVHGAEFRPVGTNTPHGHTEAYGVYLKTDHGLKSLTKTMDSLNFDSKVKIVEVINEFYESHRGRTASVSAHQ